MRGDEEKQTLSPNILEIERRPGEDDGEWEGGGHLGGICMTVASQTTSLGLVAFILKQKAHH